MLAEKPTDAGAAGAGEEATHSYRLVSGVDAPGQARTLLRECIGERPWLSDALLATSELVTNAVRYGPVGEVISLHATVSGEGLRLEVRNRLLPSSRPGEDESGGWGLHLVDAVADAWGMRHVEHALHAWFEIGDRPEG